MSGTYSEDLFDGDGNPVGENNRSGWTDTWVIFNGQHVAHYQNGETYFMHANNVGTTAFVTDYTGAIVQDELHYPWGQEWTVVGTMQEERYASLHHRDGETALDPTHYRMYSSVEYRWFTPDPLQAGIFTPQASSNYAYAMNNPTTFTDPLGLDSCTNTLNSDGSITTNCIVNGGEPPVLSLTLGVPCYMSDGYGCGYNGYNGSYPYPYYGGGGVPKPAPKPAPKPSPPSTPSCYTVWLDALKNAINPFGPGLASLVEPGAAYLSAVYYNQALGYAASQALTYPFKSSVFRGLLSFSNDIAGSYPLIQLDAALFQADVDEASAARSGQCH